MKAAVPFIAIDFWIIVKLLNAKIGLGFLALTSNLRIPRVNF
uniref:Uncharacterized protein n=1 Tax=Raoultella planticola TaxID=575 RepID=W8CUU5_RAOPL|nr:hypothetical protein pKpNDM1_00593 [Raoultella planticola]